MSFLQAVLYQWFVLPFSIVKAAWEQGDFIKLNFGLMMTVYHLGFTAMYLAGFVGFFKRLDYSRKLKFFLYWSTVFVLVVVSTMYLVDRLILSVTGLP